MVGLILIVVCCMLDIVVFFILIILVISFDFVFVIGLCEVIDFFLMLSWVIRLLCVLMFDIGFFFILFGEMFCVGNVLGLIEYCCFI